MRRLIAVGESQSSAGLDLYRRYGADRDARVFDAFLIDGDAHSTIPRSYRVPTMHLWSEESAQPVEATWENNHRIWMVAGAAHIDRWAVDQALPQLLRSATTGGVSTGKDANAALRRSSGDYGQYGPNASSECMGGSEFPRRYAVDAAMAALERWVRTGTPAPRAPSLRFTSLAGTSTTLPTLPYLPGLPVDGLYLVGLLASPAGLVRDRNGNAVGGLRLPVMRLPVATYDGTGCLLLGTSTPFAPAKLAGLYSGHGKYVRLMIEATRAAVDSRFMTRRDGLDLLRRACRSAIPAIGRTPPSDRPVACTRLRQLL